MTTVRNGSGTKLNIADHIRDSNKIEGVTLEREVDNSLEAWFYLRRHNSLTHDVVISLHRLIMINLLGPHQFGYRPYNVQINGVKRQLPHHVKVPELMQQWLEEVNISTDPKDMHIKFEHIHPFVDGNGRTGRMLMWKHEMDIGLVPTRIKFDEREEYYKWFD